MSIVLDNKVRMIAWEVTRSCNLNCVHCRAASSLGPYSGELSTEKCLQLVHQIAAVSTPVIILTGGEPLLRQRHAGYTGSCAKNDTEWYSKSQHQH